MPNTSLQFRLLNFQENWQGIKHDWNKLFLSCVNPCVFYHAGFIEAAYQSMNERRPTHIALGYKEKNLVFGLPCSITQRAGSHEFEFYSGPGFDHLAPLDSSENGEFSLDFFANGPKQFHFNAVKIDNVSEPYGKILRNTKILKSFSRPAFRCPYFPLPENAEQLLNPFNSKFRSNLNRRMRLLQDLGVSFRFSGPKTESKTLETSFQNLVELHSQRSESKEIQSQFVQDAPLSFYKNFCQTSTEFPGVLKFVEAIHEKKVVGSLMGFINGHTFHFYQHGFTREYAKYALGSVLIFKMMEESIKNNLKFFDFLRGADNYKFSWTSKFTTDTFLSFSPGLTGIPAVYQHQLRYYRRRYGKFKGTVLGLIKGNVP